MISSRSLRGAAASALGAGAVAGALFFGGAPVAQAAPAPVPAAPVTSFDTVGPHGGPGLIPERPGGGGGHGWGGGGGRGGGFGRGGGWGGHGGWGRGGGWGGHGGWGRGWGHGGGGWGHGGWGRGGWWGDRGFWGGPGRWWNWWW
jgi:hypothetical protein